MPMLDTRRKSITEIVGADSSAARLARGPRQTVAPRRAKNNMAAAQVAADAGKPAIAAALAVMAAGNVSPKSMRQARAIAGSAKLRAPGQAQAVQVINRLKAKRDAGDPKAQRALDTIALAARVNHENERDLTPSQELEAEQSAARQAIAYYNPSQDPVVAPTVAQAREEQAILRDMVEQVETSGLGGSIDKFRQGERQIRGRKLGRLVRFMDYRGRTAVVGRLPENYWLPGSDITGAGVEDARRRLMSSLVYWHRAEHA